MEIPNIKIEYSPQQLKKLGLYTISLIRDRTAKGLDKDNKAFKAYTTKPFSMPYAAANKSAVKQLVKENKAIIFKREKTKWVLFKTGYLDYKRLAYKGTSYDGTVNLMLTSRMLGNLNVISIENNKVVIGFPNQDMALRAKYNIDKGRDFLGLSDLDLKDAKFNQLLAEGLSIK